MSARRPASFGHGVLPPKGRPGRRIGLFGGSFNPAHGGHRHVATTALKRLRLDEVWFVVAAGNPLKSQEILAGFEARLASASALAATIPRARVTAVEAHARLRYSVDVVTFVLSRRPQDRFIWLMGSDALIDLHHWRRWREIAARTPIAVIARPGAVTAALRAPAAVKMARARVADRDAADLAARTPPAWCFLRGPLDERSSTRMRREGHFQ